MAFLPSVNPPDSFGIEDSGTLVCPCCGYWKFDHNFKQGFLDWSDQLKYVICQFCNGKTFMGNLVKLDMLL